jgi:hypothetical protein
MRVWSIAGLTRGEAIGAARGVGAVAVAFTLGALACGGDATSPTPPRAGGIALVGRATIDDTVRTEYDSVTLEIHRPNGALVTGAPVMVRGHHAPYGTKTPSVLLYTPATGETDSIQAMTDQLGRVQLVLMFGAWAGQTDLTVEVPADGLRDSLPVTVRPGEPYRIAVVPADSVLWVGHRYPLRVEVQDIGGNARPDPLSVAVASGPVTLGATRVVTATGLGRARLHATAATLAADAFVSVVPIGELATHCVAQPPIRPGGICLLNTDGTAMRYLVQGGEFGPDYNAPRGPWPAWFPSGAELAFDETGHLKRVDLIGQVTDVFDGGPLLPVSDEFALAARADWIYVTRGTFGSQKTVWRIRPDGSAAEQVSEGATAGTEAMPSPNPNGDRVVFQSNLEVGGLGIRIVTLASGVITALPVKGTSPRWSPVDDRIAYLDIDNHLRITGADGTGDQAVATTIALQPGFNWSPDGQWLVGVSKNLVASQDALQFVRVATGETLQAMLRGPAGENLLVPAWKPGP